MHRNKIYTLLVLAFCFSFSNSYGGVYTVNSLGAANTGSGNSGTLYYCIGQANALPGPHTVNFSVAGTIPINNLSYILPPLKQAITIDGTTAPGYSGTPVVTINGAGLLNYRGLQIDSANCEVYGLEIINFPYAGIEINSDAADNFIIGATGKGNILRNNKYWGIEVEGADSGIIAYNKIGTNAAGSACAGNLYDGVYLNGGANHNSVMSNHISCNGYNGISINGSNDNEIKGNILGPLQNSCSGNIYSGIAIASGSTGNIVGGTNAADFNKISGNHYWGISVSGVGTVNNSFIGNSYACNLRIAIILISGGNNNIAAPAITMVNGSTISGTSLPNSVIEIFNSQNTNSALCPSTPLNQGTDYIGAVTADGSGNWSVNGAFSGYIVATQRDTSGNTSTFSTAAFTGETGVLLNNCSGEVIVGTHENHSPGIMEMSLFPNPTSRILFLKAPGVKAPVDLLLYNSFGEEVWKQNAVANLNDGMQLQLPPLPAGIYFLRLNASSGSYALNSGQSLKVVIQ